MKYKIIFLIFIIFLNLNLFSQEKLKTKVLFVFYDAGETIALLPVLSELDKFQVDYKVLLMATARNFRKSINPKKIIDISSCEISEKIEAISWPRERKLTLESLNKLKGCIIPRIIISGMVSEVQRQIGTIFRPNLTNLIGYYDAFTEIDSTSIVATFKEFPEIWIPSNLQLRKTKKIFPTAKIKVVGQPSLESWTKKRQRISIKNFSKHRLGWATILYAGGYGKGYASSFEIFVKSVNNMTQFNIYVSLHPKVDGFLEREILKRYKNKNILILPKEIKTSRVASVADIIVSQNSTVGTQAIFMGKISIFLDLPTSKYKAFVIQKGLAKKISSSDDFIRYIKQISFKKPKKTENISLFYYLGIPTDSSRKIGKMITDML